MKLNTVSPEEMRRILYLSKNDDRRFIKSYTVFETVRSEVRKLLNDKSVLDTADSDVYLAWVNAWVFDRIFNGAWEYTNPDVVDGLTPFDQDFINTGSIYRAEKPKKKVVVQPSSFSRILKRAKDILFSDVDSELVSSVLTSASRYSDSEMNKNSSFFDAKNYPTSGWNPKVRPADTWGASVAIYGQSKKMLLVNEMYCRNMDINPIELEYMVKAWTFKDLVDVGDYQKLEALLKMLMEGKSYKDQVLRTSRTNKLIAWNSIWNPESGSIRIGRDVTYGETHRLESTPGDGFRLRGEDLFTGIREEVIERIKAIDTSGFDADDREEFELRKISIDTKLRVLCACGSAVDQCWENGPFLMNLIDGDKICGNGNYANFIWMKGEVSKSDIYSPEQQDRMDYKFTQWRATGHYESSFIMQLKNGTTPASAWHRFFALSDKPNLWTNISFGIGTTTIHR